MFEVPKRKRYTQTSLWEINHYQLDYILVKSNFNTIIKSCYSYHGAEVDSDHKLVMVKYCLKHKKYQVKSKKTVKFIKNDIT